MYQYREAQCGPVTTGIYPRRLNRNRAIPRSIPMAAFGYGSMIQKSAPTPASISTPAPLVADPELTRLREENARLGREVADVRRRASVAEQRVVELEREIVLLKRQHSILPPPEREIQILPMPAPGPITRPPEREIQILPMPAPGPITRPPGEATILPIAPARPRDTRYYPLDDAPVRISIPRYGRDLYAKY